MKFGSISRRVRRWPFVVILATLCMLLPTAAFAAAPDDEYWVYRFEEVEGEPTFKFTNKKFTIVMKGVRTNSSGFHEGGFRVDGEGPEKGYGESGTFIFSDHYAKGICKLELGGHKLRIKDRGMTLEAGRRTFKIDGKRDIKLTIAPDGKIEIDPKDAEVK